MSSPVEQEQNLEELQRHTEAQSIFFRPIELYVPCLQQEQQPLLAKRHSTELSMIDADDNHKRKKTSHP